MALTVFLVDDNRTFLDAADGVLATVEGISVIGQASSGLDALAKIEALKPDLVLLDIGLPDISGIDVGLQLSSWARPPHIVYVSLHDETGYASLLERVGAIGFIHKANFVTELLPLLETFAQDPTRDTRK